MDLASSLTVIGWFVQVLFDQGITFAIDHCGGAGAAPDLPSALERFREAINNVRALLHITRKIRSENEGLLESVNDLKDAAYDAEDILSELEYYRLQKEVEGNNTLEGGLVSSIKGAVSRLLEDTQASSSSPPPSVFDIKDTIRRINEVVARLDRIIPDVRGLLALLNPEERDADSHVSTSHRVTTSFVSSKQPMFGREHTKAHIIDVLLNGQPAASDVWVLPIIGAGGIGKTTLAREVYNDKRVAEHFDCTLWLYVSENFDVPRLTREMLEILGVEGSSQMKSPERLQTLLYEKLCSKKFLIVMDDVWNDADSQKWTTLCAPLESGKTGSRILLTTRLDTVVEMVGKEGMNVFGCSVKLKGLPEGEYLSLFNKYAFGVKEPGDHSNLAEIGKQIAGKLDGSPLAAKTVGSLLRENLDVEHWRSILSSDIWKLPQRQDDIMPVLKLSYQHLPVHLQQCFAYCCIFPKGKSSDPRDLVRMWIAHGYIDTKTSGNKRMEDIGWEYFKILLARSFLEGDPNWFVVHDLFHDLAQSVSADESFTINTNNQNVPRRVRHLSLSSDHITLVLQKSYLRNLRTLIIFPGRAFQIFDLLEELFNELKSVRVLYSPLLDVPHNIGHLIHLRYIHVPHIGERSFCRLYHLQYLQFFDAKFFSKHHRIDKLPCLQELEYFVIEEGRKIGVLKNLNQLGGSLTLQNLENLYTREEALEAELSKKIHIRNLGLICKNSHTSPEVAEEVFEGIRPPAYIKELLIDGYGGVNTPSWMVHEIQRFSNLQSLRLFNCLKWKDLPPLGQLPSLRHLVIYKADAVEIIGRGFYGTGNAKGFQCLETLEFLRMPQLVEWSGIGDDSGFLFPRLRVLIIKGCPKLEQVLIKDLTSLEKLYIIELEEPLSVELLTDLTMEQGVTSLRELYITQCPRLNFLPLLPASLEKLWVHECRELNSLPLLPASLKILSIYKCPELNSLSLLPASLKNLSIHRCPELNSLPPLPASLEELALSDCPKLSLERYEEGGDEWNKIAQNCPKLSYLILLPPSTSNVRIVGLPTGQDPLYQESEVTNIKERRI